MATELATRNGSAPLPEIIEQVLISGDLARLDAGQRVHYYNHVCNSVGLNPATRPFDYITLNGKLTLYARRDCTDQLRAIRNVSVTIKSREQLGEVFVVCAQASLPNGRVDESVGAVTTVNLKGDALANALMKCETKAKRRVTLSICGLGFTDETEIETIPGARPDLPPPPPQRATPAKTQGQPKDRFREGVREWTGMSKNDLRAAAQTIATKHGMGNIADLTDEQFADLAGKVEALKGMNVDFVEWTAKGEAVPS